jgi:putative CocE/NonD family hydrolase
MGANRWRFEDSWPLERAEDHALYFAGETNDRIPGGLVWDRPEHTVGEFDFDPRNPVPTRGGAHLLPEFLYPQGPMRQEDLDARPDILVFEGPLLDADVEVTGWIRAQLWVQSTVGFTDYTVKLMDVWPDGRSFNVCDGIARVKLDSAHLVREWRRIEVSLGGTSMVFKRGHRLKVHISSSNFPRFDVNPNTGEPVHLAATTVVADQRMSLGGSAASHLVLPVVAGE